MLSNQLVWAVDPSAELDDIRKEIQELRKSNAEKDTKLERMGKRLEQIEAKPAREPRAKPISAGDSLDQAIQDLDEKPVVSRAPATVGLFSRPMGAGATLRLIDVSLNVLFAAGGSSESDLSLQNIQSGDHDPKKRGFTLGNAELSLAGAVDPYFTGEAHIIYKIDALSGESAFELEEAFLKTLALPLGLQVKAGHYFTEFGRLNPTHPHAWLWQDQPVIHSRVFGADGLRSPGMRVAWLMPLPWFAEFYTGVQNANGETAHSFLANDEVSIGGHPFFDRAFKGPAELLYSTRLVNSFNLSKTVTTQIGVSGLFGPNSTGSEARTYIYGGDIVVKWRPVDHFRGWPFLIFESEAIHRIYEAENFFDVGEDPADPADDVFVKGEWLNDYGFYAQLLYGFYPRWAAGVRYEYATGDNQAFAIRQLDPFRDDRHRVSPLLAFYLSEFSRLRLQYNYDKADHLWNDAHSVWAGIEFSFGTHPPHVF